MTLPPSAHALPNDCTGEAIMETGRLAQTAAIRAMRQ